MAGGFVRLRVCGGLVLRWELSTGRTLGAGVILLVLFGPLCAVVSSAFTKSGQEPALHWIGWQESPEYAIHEGKLVVVVCGSPDATIRRASDEPGRVPC